MKTINKYIAIAATLFGMSSCSDFLEEYSQDLSRVQNIDDLQELVMGSCLVPEAYIYTANSNYAFRNNNFAMLHLMGDELQENLTAEIGQPGYFSCTEEYFPYFTWQKDASIDYKGSSSMQANEAWYWDKPYELIGNCNMILAETNKMNVTLDEDVARMNRVKGEALYLRASYYYMLVNLYGKPYNPSTAASTPAVPLKISETIEDVEFQRNSVAEIYNQILADLTQAERDDVMYRFKTGELDVLVATDIVSRGIDIDDIQMVINYDVPHDVEDYVHRIGRTARADRDGIAYTLVSDEEIWLFKKIEEFLEKEITKNALPEGIGEAPEYKVVKPAKANRKGHRNSRKPNGRGKTGEKKQSRNNNAGTQSKSPQKKKKYYGGKNKKVQASSNTNVQQ